MVFIYGLIDPNTFKVRYIGKTNNLKQRYQRQLCEKSNTYRCNWIQSLLSMGKKPIQVILQTLEDDQDWEIEEIKWIAIAKKYGWNLVNATSGGDGVKNIPEDSKNRMMAGFGKGAKHTLETLIKISKSSKGRVKSEESKDKLSLIMVGREIKWKDKIQESVKKFSDSEVKFIQEELKTNKVIDLAKKYNVHRTTISKIKAGTYNTFKQKTVNYIKTRRYHNKI